MSRKPKIDLGLKFRDDPAEYHRRHREANPIHYLLNQARYRAKKIGVEFDITLDDLVVPDICPIFGIPLFFTRGGRTDNSFSLDRWDNSKGYVKGNVRVISWKANMYKGNMTVPEVRRLLAYMEGSDSEVPRM